MTKDQVQAEYNRRMQAVAQNVGLGNSTARDYGLDDFVHEEPAVYAPGEVEALTAAAAEEARKIPRAKPGFGTPGINYDELTEEQRKAIAGRISGSDEEDAERIAEYDRLESEEARIGQNKKADTPIEYGGEQ